MLAERWRVHYNTVRPHSSLGYRAPAPAAWLTETSRGMEKWKAKSASHFPTPPTAATSHIIYPSRYTNNLAGTKDRAGHSTFVRYCLTPKLRFAGFAAPQRRQWEESRELPPPQATLALAAAR